MNNYFSWQQIYEAWNDLLKLMDKGPVEIPGSKDMFCRAEKGYKISKEIYDILRPFFESLSEHVFWIGNVQLKVSYCRPVDEVYHIDDDVYIVVNDPPNFISDISRMMDLKFSLLRKVDTKDFYCDNSNFSAMHKHEVLGNMLEDLYD